MPLARVGRSRRASPRYRRIHVVDSHTEGEPTRVVTSGGPELGRSSAARRQRSLARDHDQLRRVLVGEPRGIPEAVGALLGPGGAGVLRSVVYFNNVGYLGMCGHGTIGVLATLHYLGELPAPSSVRLDTSVGPVRATLHDAHSVSVENVPSYRYRSAVVVDVPSYGPLRGEVAWGGNWFFLAEDPPIPLLESRIPELTRYATTLRQALVRSGVTGRGGAAIDHIELSGPSPSARSDSRNFVLCPGGAYDRSPCGTGTSAKLACLAAEGRLREGAVWRQESIIGTVFEARYRRQGRKIVPTIRGRAYITGETEVLIDPSDPLAG